jgi:hypothetical protein
VSFVVRPESIDIDHINHHTRNDMKYGVQITTTKDGAWSVSQLKQEEENGAFTRIPRSVEFVDYSNPLAAQRLLDAIARGLRGKLRPGARKA